MRGKVAFGVVLLGLSAISRFGKAMLGVIGLAGVVDDAPAWIRALENPWIYGSLFIAGLTMSALALLERIGSASGPDDGSITQTARSGGNTVQAGRDVHVGNIYHGHPEAGIGELLVQAAQAAERARTAMTLDSTELAASDFRAALAMIERFTERAPDAARTAPLVHELRRASAPPFQFAQPGFTAKLEQLEAALQPQDPEPSIEVRFDIDENSFVGILPAYSGVRGPRNGSMISAGLDGVRILNHDSSSTVIDRVWLEIDDFEIEVSIGRNDAEIPGRDYRVLNGLEAKQFIEKVLNRRDGAERLRFCVKAIGLGTFCKGLPEELFQLEGADP